MTCTHFARDQICTQVDASCSPFGHSTQVNASCLTSINVLLANEIQDMSALKWFSLRLACSCEETCQCVWPPNASLYASSTCHYLRSLDGLFDQGLIVLNILQFLKETDLKDNKDYSLCSLLGTDNVHGQISEHISGTNGG